MKLIENGKIVSSVVYNTITDSVDDTAISEYCLFTRLCTSRDQYACASIPSNFKNYVFIGANNEFAKQFGVVVPREKFSDDTIYILVKDNFVVLDGGKRGKLYAVYEFLERFLGVRFYAPEDNKTPLTTNLIIPDQEIIYTPAITSRYVYTTDNRWSREFCARMRVDQDSTAKGLSNFGGSCLRTAFPSCHTTFSKFLPPDDPETGFAKHPEYYSYLERRGCRVGAEFAYKNSGGHWGEGDICWTNPDVINIVTEKTKQWILDNPDKNVFDISQADWGSPCECPKCKEIAYKYGKNGEPRWAAQVIYLLNAVSKNIKEWKKTDERVKDREIYLQTMAYHKGEDAPVGLEVDDHVLVKLIIHACYYHQLDDENCAMNNIVRERLNDWSKLTNNLLIWDYANNFAFSLLYNSVLPVIQKRMQYYSTHGVKGIFLEYTVSNQYPGTWFKLRAYLYSMTMWNPNLDFNKEYKMAMEHFYGQGAPMMMELERRYQECIALDAKRNEADPEIGQYHLPSAYVITSDHYTDEFFKIGEDLFNIALDKEKNEKLRFNIRKEQAIFKFARAYMYKGTNYIEMQEALDGLKNFGIYGGRLDWFKDHFFGGDRSDFFIDAVADRNKKNMIKKLMTELF